MSEYLDREKVLSVFDGLIAARERCKNCSARQTTEYMTLKYARDIIEKIPSVSAQERDDLEQ